MDLTELLDEYSIDYITSGQDSSKDYVNIHCSVGCLENETFKRGIRRNLSFSTCWVCGEKLNAFQTAKHLGIPWKVWKEVMEANSTESKEDFAEFFPDDTDDIEFPGSEFLDDRHKSYLQGRGIDWKFLQKHYGIRGTLRDADWLNINRIIVPIHYEGTVISYLMRTIDENPKNRRYMMCRPEVESFHHKHSFFNIDNVTNKKVLLVEGVFDLFKLVQASGNFNVISSYGTAITKEQLTLLRDTFDEVIVLYDKEELAQKNAQKIVVYLRTFGVKARSVVLKHVNDPAELTDEEAKVVVEGILGGE